MRSIANDMKYAARMLVKRPGFTAIALLTLAISVGVNTTMLSISDLLLLLQPQGIKAPEQLALCTIRGAAVNAFYYSGYQTLRDSCLAFGDLMAQTGGLGSTTLVHGDSAWEMRPLYVSSNYFSFLGVTPTMGRGFLSEEERAGSVPVTVLSHRLWRRLGADPKHIGQFLKINGTECRVVGVTPESFTGAALMGPDLWLSMGSYRVLSNWHRTHPPRANASPDDDYPWCDILGRLMPGLDLSTAQAQLQSLVPQFQAAHPRQWMPHSTFALRRPGRFIVNVDDDDSRLTLTVTSLVLMITAILILIIACLNLANMLMVQGAGRRREIAVRMAVGGSRLRIIRQLFVESLLLGLLGGACGILLAICAMRLLNVYIAGMPDRMTSSLRVALNMRILAATLGVSLLGTLLFGLRPALLLSRRDISGQMQTMGTRVLGHSGGKRRGVSVVVQIAMAVVLVLSASLLTRSALQVARPDPRFCLTDKLVVQVDPLCAGRDQAQSIEACKPLVDHLASLPEIEALGTSPSLFYGGGGYMAIREHQPGTDQGGSRGPLIRNCEKIDVDRDYFAAMDLPLLQGRPFDRRDHAPDAEKVAIIDESLARKLRPDGQVIDHFIQWSVPAFGEIIPDLFRVVGVVPNRPGVRDSEQPHQMYTPTGPDALSRFFYIHASNDASIDGLRQRIVEEVHRVAADIPVLSVRTLAELRQENSSVWLARLGANMAIMAGVTALFLATLGIYAVKGYMVASQTSDIGIRMALGATHKNVMSMVLREDLALTIVGLVAGLGMGLGVAKVAANLLYGISPVDPASIVMTVMMLTFATLLASSIPARRATRIDPMEALRYE